MNSDVYEAFISAPGTYTVTVQEMSTVFNTYSAPSIPNENAEGQRGTAARKPARLRLAAKYGRRI